MSVNDGFDYNESEIVGFNATTSVNERIPKEESKSLTLIIDPEEEEKLRKKARKSRWEKKECDDCQYPVHHEVQAESKLYDQSWCTPRPEADVFRMRLYQHQHLEDARAFNIFRTPDRACRICLSLSNFNPFFSEKKTKYIFYYNNV